MRRNPQSLWNDERVKGCLQQFPPIKDRQSKEKLYQSIQEKIQARELLDSKSQDSVFTRRIPILASIAAIILVIMIVPSLLKDFPDSARDMNINDTGVSIVGDQGDAGGLEVAETGETIEVDNRDETNRFVEDNGNGLTVPVPYTVDVTMADGTREFHSFIVQEWIPFSEDTGKNIEEMLVYVFTSHENGIGATEIFQGLESIEIHEREGTVTMNFSKGHGLGTLATGEMNIATSSIIEVFSLYGFEEVKFTVNGELGVQYGAKGYVEGFELLPENRGYYMYVGEEGRTYFIRGAALEEPLRNTADSLFTFEETLEKMKWVQPGAWYRPAIPESVQFDSVIVDSHYAVIEISEEEYELKEVELERVIEAIQLAARDFSIEQLTIRGSLVSRFRESDSIDMEISSIY
ncbi:hypothetical protein J2S74_000438 [Evansella vedderi]|uniref:GerMN domain-containing protein n=1 Tax=Evansella vedderi TaxID=38282 RepID=A0ABT9ZP96_9BACI|nr:hypothetical protein [Evansella vedderi]MDQ0253066.1 hypothetical protein [Evansella vedderi]